DINVLNEYCSTKQINNPVFKPPDDFIYGRKPCDRKGIIRKILNYGEIKLKKFYLVIIHVMVLLLIAIPLFFVSGCGSNKVSGESQSEPTLRSIIISPLLSNLGPLQNQQYTAYGYYSDGTIEDITNKSTWSCNNASAGVITTTTGYFTAANPSFIEVGEITAILDSKLSNIARVFVIPSGTQSVSVGAGGYHSLAFKNDVSGLGWSWGRNGDGQLGVGDWVQRDAPAQVSSITTIIAISGGDLHSMALRNNGTVMTWGSNSEGQLGNGTTVDANTPQAPGLTGIIDVSAGMLHSMALRSDGTVWTWGDNYYGQLGDGTFIDSWVPKQISLDDIIAISAGGHHSMALMNDGTVWTWGDNYYGQLGNNSLVGSPTPVQVNISNVIEISAGYFHSMALKNDGTVWVWGYNGHGQLGDGTTSQALVPQQVPSLNNVSAISGGGGHSLFLINGTVWSCGWNNHGQVGNNSTFDQDTPVQVWNIADIISISAGYQHSLAVQNDGTTWSWGGNDYGQLGNGNSGMGADEYVPVSVNSF
ncbi:MAG: hypothetical protein J7M18_01310, partial [Candidatus Eremiobacteraeota bacterium]|nr:hypothetical protein [Candidatus Eremiobacteraeota bacterium]